MNPVPDLVELPDANESMSLASRARAGDSAALGELLARYEPWLRRIARIELGARLRRRVDSMDLVQEVGLVAIRRIGDLEVTSAPAVRKWLRSILGYEFRELLKASGAGKRDLDREVSLADDGRAEGTTGRAPEPPAPDTLPDLRAERRELRDVLDEVVSELPAEYRAVVLLRDYDRASWEEVRRALPRETVDAARQLHRRAWLRITSLAGSRLGRP